MGKQISTLFAARIIGAAAAAGIDPAPLFRHTGITADTVNFPPISEERHLALWELIMRTARDPAFPIRYAEHVTIDDYGVLGLACKTAPRLGDALALVEKHLPVYTDSLVVRIERSDAAAWILIDRQGPLTLARRVSTESTIAELVGAVRAITGSPIVPHRVTFRHPAFGKAGEHQRFFGVTPQFGAARDGAELSLVDLDEPVLRHDAALHAFLRREVEKLSSALSTHRDANVMARTEAEILRLLPHSPLASNVARALGLSVRSLQRHLAREGTTFDAVLDRARLGLADALLADGKYSVAEVADATGFSDPASFSRAYKRWTSAAPSTRRRGLRG